MPSLYSWLCAFLLVAAGDAVRADQALDDYNLGVQLYKQGRWVQAADTFRKFIRDHAGHDRTPFARLYLGLTLINQSEFQAARETLRAFAKDYPENQNIAQARYRIAECSYLLNDLPSAKADLERYLKDHSSDQFAERALPYLGDVLLRLNEAAAAEKVFAEAVRRFPEGSLADDARFGWARALEAQRRMDDALAKYKELADGSGARAAEAAFQLGSRQFERQQFTEAADTYRNLARRFPESPLKADAQLNAGFALYRAGKLSEAARQFEVAAAAPDKEVTASYWRALSLKAAGDYTAAADLLTQLAPRTGMHPLAESILFQRGVCERFAGRTAAAQQSFLDVVARYPQGELADDALHFAGELAIEAGDLAAASKRLEQFDREYSRSGLRMHQDLLAGRYDLLRASRSASAEEAGRFYAAAAARFEAVLQNSTLPRTRGQSRYYLALTRQLQGNHPAALEAIAPVIEDLGNAPELADALVLQADSWLQLGQPEPAIGALERYLTEFPRGRQTPRALSLSAVAQARSANPAASNAALDRLLKDFPRNPLAVSTLLQLAELADERREWAASAGYYRQLQTVAAGTDDEPFAWRGLGFSLLQQKKYGAARDALGHIVRDFANHRLALEAAFYHAEAWREEGQFDKAASEFQAAFQRGAPATAAAAGDEQRPPLLHAYLAGLQAARTLKQSGRVDDADRAYAALLEKFPHAQRRDRVLDEWALLNYEAQRYDAADAIFRRLIDETPDSDLADNARLSLAESDLLADRFDAARQSFEALLTDNRSDDEVRERAQFQLIVLSLEQQRWAEVRDRAAKYLAAYPESPDRPYVEYCRCEAQLADPRTDPAALTALLKDIDDWKSAPAPQGSAAWHPRLWLLQAEALLKLKRYDELAPVAADFKQKHPQAPSYHLDEILGRSFKQQARFPEARQAFERVLADPQAFRTETAAKAQFLIGETYLLEEKWADAFLAYQKVYASYAFPEWQAEALLQSGKCDEQLGQWSDAAKTYARLIDEFPESPRVAEAKQRLEAARKRAAR